MNNLVASVINKNQLTIWKKKDFFSKMKKDYPDNEEIERTIGNINFFDFKNGEELTQLFLGNDVSSLAGVFEKFKKVTV